MMDKLLLFKGKKGDIPVMILVLGVFAICAMAILTFYFNVFKFTNSFYGYELVEKVNSDIDLYNFYKSQGFSDDETEKAVNHLYSFYVANGFSANEAEKFKVLKKEGSGYIIKERNFVGEEEVSVVYRLP